MIKVKIEPLAWASVKPIRGLTAEAESKPICIYIYIYICDYMN